jgi:hypothetical protein
LLLEDLIAFGDASALEFVTRVLRSTGSRFAALYRHLPRRRAGLIRRRRRRVDHRACGSVGGGRREEEALRSLGPIDSDGAWNEGVQQLAPLLSAQAVQSLLSGARELRNWSVGALCRRLGEQAISLPRCWYCVTG